MKHSELLKLKENAPEMAAGVIVDDIIADTCPQVKRIAFTALPEDQSEPVWLLSYDVTDGILSYLNCGAEVILEVAFDSNFDKKILMSEMANAGASVSVIAPESLKEPLSEQNMADFTGYMGSLYEWMSAYLSYKQATIELLPFSGFFAYLILRELGDSKNENVTNDEYMKLRFVDGLHESVMDELKKRLEDEICSERVMGSLDELRQFAHSIASVAYRYTKDYVTHLSEKASNKEPTEQKISDNDGPDDLSGDEDFVGDVGDMLGD